VIQGKILILNSANSYWGAEVSLMTFIENIPAHSYSLYIRNEPGDFEHLLKSKNIAFSKISLELSPYKIKFYSCLFTLKKIIKSEKQTVVYCNNDDLSTLVATLKIISFFRIKTFIHIRNIPREFDYIKKLMFFHNKVISNSRYTLNSLVKGLVCKPTNISIIHNAHGLDNSSFKKQEKTNLGKYLLTVGRLQPNKAQLEVITILHQKKLFNKIDYYLVGGRKDEDSNYKNKILNYIKNNQLIKKVHLQCFTSGIEKYYFNAVATIIPSYIETFGRAAIESGFWSTPVIARDIGSLCEIIEHNHSGLIWDGTPNQLTNYIEKLNSDTDFRNYLGNNLREEVIKKYSNIGYVNNLLSTFGLTYSQ